ncbi:hypothetical protein [Georgenia subflava]|uniref:Uncharacterized protein n=1 Tax=Georgenia subflava TaxID=1622177 RepID=A0A6N7EM25_9MICO|nr:hypothetical protein [Georgenia subflava]MPV38491.1 hypothetical protein [Georgenia subflava]
MADRPFRPSAGAVAGAVAVVVGVAALLVVLDRPPGVAVLAGAATAVICVLVLTRGLGHAGGFAELPEPVRAGTRYTISQLSAGMTGRDGRVRGQVVNRLHDVAATRLALHGLDLSVPADHAAVRALLGEPAAVLLDGGPPPTETDVARCLDALESLTPTTQLRRNR